MLWRVEKVKICYDLSNKKVDEPKAWIQSYRTRIWAQDSKTRSRGANHSVMKFRLVGQVFSFDKKKKLCL
jgi:hypothetical protein